MNSDFSDFIRFFPIFRLFPTFRLLDSTTLIRTHRPDRKIMCVWNGLYSLKMFFSDEASIFFPRKISFDKEGMSPLNSHKTSHIKPSFQNWHHLMLGSFWQVVVKPLWDLMLVPGDEVTFGGRLPSFSPRPLPGESP